MMRVSYEELKGVMVGVLRGVGMEGERAEVCGGLFADASRDGVASHGVNRFAGFVKHLREGVVVRDAVAKKVGGVGAMERWDGGYGVGPLNARICMGRAVELAGMFGIGCVALGKANHWMRAGNYGWQAAEAGCVGICWTNATPTMAAWGGKGRSVGNNPLVMAVPRANGEHVVLDMAMSQFSFGKLGMLERAGVEAPLVAGFDGEGKETTNPGKILRGGTLMPIGYWKGSGMGMVLDMIAAGMAGGMASWEVAKGKGDKGVSQLFLAMDVKRIGGSFEEMERTVEGILESVKKTGEDVRYPGEGALRARRESLEKGVAVDGELWGEILKLEGA